MIERGRAKARVLLGRGQVECGPALLAQVSGVLEGKGHFVLEFASKRHLKAIIRYVLRRQSWNPFDHTPYEFVEMNLDFHPTWMQERLSEAMFHVKRKRTVSHFRLPFLKRAVPAKLLAAMDGICQPTGALWQLTPSVFVQCTAENQGTSSPSQRLFRCPDCGHDGLDEHPEMVACRICGGFWPIEDGIYNFKLSSPV